MQVSDERGKEEVVISISSVRRIRGLEWGTERGGVSDA